jgi:hypothetical protein
LAALLVAIGVDGGWQLIHLCQLFRRLFVTTSW